MGSAPQTKSNGNSRLFLLVLGLLVGCVIAFVLLLSRLPVGDPMSDVGEAAGVGTDNAYQFYSVLLEQNEKDIVTAAQEVAAPAAVVIPPATRVVPGSVQSLSARSLAAESYKEIPPSSVGNESYFLQAGNYRYLDDAEKSRAALLLLGLDAFVVAREDSNGTTSHRVRIGPFYDKSNITKAKERLQRNGINYKLIRVSG